MGKEKIMEKENSNKPSFSYYSNMLNKPFETLKELQEAEAAELAKKEAEDKKVAEKKADAKAVEDAYKTLVATKKDAYKKVADAEDAYEKAVQAFVDKYGSYHMTYSDKDGRVSLGVSDMVDAFFSDIFKYF